MTNANSFIVNRACIGRFFNFIRVAESGCWEWTWRLRWILCVCIWPSENRDCASLHLAVVVRRA
jgi:hypothetical protein